MLSASLLLYPFITRFRKIGVFCFFLSVWDGLISGTLNQLSDSIGLLVSTVWTIELVEKLLENDATFIC